MRCWRIPRDPARFRACMGPTGLPARTGIGATSWIGALQGTGMTQTALTFGPHSGDGPATEGVGHVILPAEMIANSQAASSFLKAVAHESRLMILCHLTTGEKSVTELENLLSSRQDHGVRCSRKWWLLVGLEAAPPLCHSQEAGGSTGYGHQGLTGRAERLREAIAPPVLFGPGKLPIGRREHTGAPGLAARRANP